MTRLAAALLIAMFVLSCGDDDPTSLGSDQRTAPDTLRVVELKLDSVFVPDVFDLPFRPTVVDTTSNRMSGVWLGASATGQVGSQPPYTTHQLFEFRVPTFVIDEGDTLELVDGSFEIGFTDAEPQSFTGAMRLALHEVHPDSTGWTDNPNQTTLPPRRQLLSDTLVAKSEFGDPNFKVEVGLDPKRLSGYDSALRNRDSLDINVACMFGGFEAEGRGFIEFPYRSNARDFNVRFVGAYPESATTGIPRPFGFAHKLTIVEYDSLYTPGENWVVSDGYRQHTYVQFPNVDTVLPKSAIVQAAHLILFQAARGDTIFGEDEVGIVVLDEGDDYDDQIVNERTMIFRTPIAAVPTQQVAINVTGNLFDQQEGTVPNHGYVLRLSNEGVKARHFEFFSHKEPDSTRHPRIRIVYGMPADFGGGGAP